MDKIQRAWVLDEVVERIHDLVRTLDDKGSVSLTGLAEGLRREADEALRPRMPLGGRLNDFPKRRVRATTLAYEVSKIADKYFDTREAIDILTDEDRRFCGLKSRNADGWTPSELLMLERKKLEIMSATSIMGRPR